MNGLGTDAGSQLGPEVERLGDRLLEWLTVDSSLSEVALTERLRRSEPLLDGSTIVAAVRRALERAHGLGAISRLLSLDRVNEVMINGPGPVWIDRGGQLTPSTVVMSRTEIDVLIERMLGPLGRRVDRSSPIVDARLADGSRVNIVVPPLAIDGPVITIRRFAATPVPLDRFTEASGVDLLVDMVRERRSVLVVGGTGAGKTTLLNAMGASIEPDERVVVVEDTTELQLPGRHVIRLEAREPNSEGIGEVTIRHLVKTALRMRPDRIVVGETRGPEALDLVMALNTGHDGSLATCHANDAAGGLRRLETLTMLADAELPLVAIRELVASAIDIVVHVERDRSGRRAIRSIAEVGDELVVSQDGPGYRLETLWRDGAG